jgi:type IV secretory pathway TrbF-like protein
MKTPQSRNDAPEIASFTRYYEHDGMLRAYANRSMFLAILFAVIALSSLGFAIYVRIQPPTVIRVDKDGNAVVVGALCLRGLSARRPRMRSHLRRQLERITPLPSVRRGPALRHRPPPLHFHPYQRG